MLKSSPDNDGNIALHLHVRKPRAKFMQTTLHPQGSCVFTAFTNGIQDSWGKASVTILNTSMNMSASGGDFCGVKFCVDFLFRICLL